jgi:hypothetical protein
MVEIVGGQRLLCHRFSRTILADVDRAWLGYTGDLFAGRHHEALTQALLPSLSNPYLQDASSPRQDALPVLRLSRHSTHCPHHARISGFRLFRQEGFVRELVALVLYYLSFRLFEAPFLRLKDRFIA